MALPLPLGHTLVGGGRYCIVCTQRKRSWGGGAAGRALPVPLLSRHSSLERPALGQDRGSLSFGHCVA